MRFHCTHILSGLLASSSFLLDTVCAIDVHGTIAFNSICKDIKDLKPTKIVLDGGKWKANVLRDGQFTFRDVDAGSYVLDVLARDFFFDQLRVDVLPPAPVPVETAATTDTPPTPAAMPIEVRPLPPGAPHHPIPPAPLPARLPYPILLHPRSPKVYVTPKTDFSVVAMFKGNPMMLMMVAMAVLMFAMPKILASMDPEDREEFLARQEKMMSVQNSMKGMDLSGGLSKLLSGANEQAAPDSSEPEQPHASDPPPQPSTGSGGTPKKGKGKRR